MEPTRKVQLFEKRSDSDPTSAFPGSTMRITAGGGIPYDARVRAARGENVTPTDTTNLLGNLHGDSNVGPTEMEFNVQLPSCHTMKEKDRHQRLHCDTTYQNIQVHHWIKVGLLHARLTLLHTNSIPDCHAPLQARSERSYKAPPLRDLNRLTLPHPLMSRHASQHLPPSIHLTRIRRQRHSPLRLWLSRCSPPPQLARRIPSHERHERRKQQPEQFPRTIPRTAYSPTPAHSTPQRPITHSKLLPPATTNAHPARPIFQPSRFRRRGTSTGSHHTASAIRQHRFADKRVVRLLRAPQRHVRRRRGQW
jgi:hypothetical protein